MGSLTTSGTVLALSPQIDDASPLGLYGAHRLVPISTVFLSFAGKSDNEGQFYILVYRHFWGNATVAGLSSMGRGLLGESTIAASIFECLLDTSLFDYHSCISASRFLPPPACLICFALRFYKLLQPIFMGCRLLCDTNLTGERANVQLSGFQIPSTRCCTLDLGWLMKAPMKRETRYDFANPMRTVTSTVRLRYRRLTTFSRLLR